MVRPRRFDLYQLCASAPPGNFAELGVYKGGTAWLFYQIAEERGCELHLFDTFKGIPEQSDIDVLRKGQFANVDIGPLLAHMPNAHYHTGVFPKSIPPYELNNLSFVHIDCDQYASCAAAIAYFWPRMRAGGILAFDDYSEFPGIQKAVNDAFPQIMRTESGITYVSKP